MVDEKTKRKLILEHARLTSQFAAGNTGAIARLNQIEEELQLQASEIAIAASKIYLEDY